MPQGQIKMPLLNSCVGFSLKAGTIFSGILGILIAGISLILLFFTKIRFKTIVIDTLPPEIVKIIFAINLFMTIFISVLLIVGAIKRNRWMMLPWVILAIMIAIGLAISIIYTSIVFFINGDVLNGVFWIIFGTISVVIFIYLWFVVFSYYQLVEAEKGKGPYGRPGRR